jgi:hypothetical protein
MALLFFARVPKCVAGGKTGSGKVAGKDPKTSESRAMSEEENV